MSFVLSPQNAEFRARIRDFINAELTAELRACGQGMTSAYADPAGQLAWQRRLHSVGWAAPAWPVAHGGCEWSIAQRYIFARECVLAGAPVLSPMGLQMCGPALLGHGTPEQQSFFLPRMLSGEHFWCQGYSEPDAGSDLASLQLEAVADGDALVCTGTKIWVTHAHAANWIFCLVRTSKEDRPQRGITFLLVDMATPGLRIEAIVNPAGENIQNRVYFDRVRVPKANVVGVIGDGWAVAKYLLEFERGGSAHAPALQVRLEAIAALAALRSGDTVDRLIDEPHFRTRLAAARVRTMALDSYEFSVMSAIEAGASPGLAASVMKIVSSELSQHLTELAVEAAGPYAAAYQPQAGVSAGPVHFSHASEIVGSPAVARAPLLYLNNRAASIYAGSNEIQRNILAKAMLSR